MNTESGFSENKFDQQISDLLADQLHEPAPDFFTEKVMHRVQQQKVTLSYEPVISRRAWVWIGIFILLLIGYSATEPVTAGNFGFTLPSFSAPLFVENLNRWISSFTLDSLQIIHASGLLLPLLGLFLVLSLHFILLNGFHFIGKNKTDKMYCL
jgi:hypothetical protein